MPKAIDEDRLDESGMNFAAASDSAAIPLVKHGVNEIPGGVGRIKSE